MDILVEFAKLGLGITVLIKEFIGKELSAGDLIELPINPSIPVRSAGIVYHKDIPLSIAANAFIEHLISSFR
jgi:DNA-binding transcriptional LysR family regulator